VFEYVLSQLVLASAQTVQSHDSARTPSKLGKSSPEESPTMNIRLSAGGGAYGFVLTSDPIRIDACITTTPRTLFPLLTRNRDSNPSDLEADLDITIQDQNMNLVPPILPHGTLPTPRTILSAGQCWSGYAVSTWGYSVSKPGQYHIAFVPQTISSNWAAAHGYRVVSDISSDVKLVRRYSDADPHFIDPPKGWISGRPACLTAYRDRTTILPALALNKAGSSGDECFFVYEYPGTILDGINKERRAASSADNTLLSENDDECGWNHVTTLTYRRKSAPYTHTEAVLLNLPTGYIVARYQRPDRADDDVAVENALDAPCLALRNAKR
jgi:hypothetical protein